MLKLRDLVLNYTNSEQATIDWLKGIGAALKNSANCNKCGSVCNFVIPEMPQVWLPICNFHERWEFFFW